MNLPEKLKNEIHQMAKEDQTVRQNPIDFEKMKQIDSKNQLVMKRIIKKYGLIGKSKYGEHLAHDAFLLVQHFSWRSIKSMEYYLSLIEKNINEVDLRDYAKLRDRVSIRNKLPQIYGTQLYINKGETIWKFRPIKDLKNIDKIRSEIGLNSLSAYAKEFEDDGDQVQLPDGYQSY